jgi:hypothetical protein
MIVWIVSRQIRTIVIKNKAGVAYVILSDMFIVVHISAHINSLIELTLILVTSDERLWTINIWIYDDDAFLL